MVERIAEGDGGEGGRQGSGIRVQGAGVRSFEWLIAEARILAFRS